VLVEQYSPEHMITFIIIYTITSRHLVHYHFQLDYHHLLNLDCNQFNSEMKIPVEKSLQIKKNYIKNLPVFHFIATLHPKGVPCTLHSVCTAYEK